MYLQAARYLLKSLMSAEMGKPLSGSSAYLADARREAGAKSSVASPDDWANPAHQLAALRWVGLMYVCVWLWVGGCSVAGTVMLWAVGSGSSLAVHLAVAGPGRQGGGAHPLAPTLPTPHLASLPLLTPSHPIPSPPCPPPPPGTPPRA